MTKGDGLRFNYNHCAFFLNQNWSRKKIFCMKSQGLCFTCSFSKTLSTIFFHQVRTANNRQKICNAENRGAFLNWSFDIDIRWRNNWGVSRGLHAPNSTVGLDPSLSETSIFCSLPRRSTFFMHFTVARVSAEAHLRWTFSSFSRSALGYCRAKQERRLSLPTLLNFLR